MKHTKLLNFHNDSEERINNMIQDYEELGYEVRDVITSSYSSSISGGYFITVVMIKEKE